MNQNVLVGGIFVLVSLGLLYALWRLFAKHRAAQSWPTASGKIIHCELNSYLDSENAEMFAAEVKYEYAVNGKRYVNDKIQLVDSSSSFRKNEESKLEPYHVGGRVRVYYPPDDPQKSVLVLRTPMWFLAILLAMAVTFFGVGLAVALS